jgi:hypothetical protein
MNSRTVNYDSMSYLLYLFIEFVIIFFQTIIFYEEQNESYQYGII